MRDAFNLGPKLLFGTATTYRRKQKTMDTLEVVEIGRDLLLTAMWLAGPPVFISLIVGLMVSIFQTITSVQEQTLSFAPRIVAVGLVIVLALPWMLTLTSAFTMRMVERMAMVTH